jgi:thioesterase domain-containing protein/acyl carrier protein
VNEYGPTESTVFSSAWSAPGRGAPLGERVPIGRSAPHVFCAVVDDDLQLVPALEPGELIVSGPGLAEGYLRAPDLTAKAFVQRDRGDGTTERIYRTGDIVRLWPDGELEWLARRDEQVKLRGLRVEPGEVEAAILAAGADLPGGINECAVLVDGHHLLAWVSPATVDETLLIAALQQRLPEAMVPARVVAMPVLPKTANDKIDKKALPRVAVDDAIVPPATDTEARIAATWAKVLGLDAVSVTKSFFALGGHSLKAAVAVRAHSDEFGVEVTLSSLMLARTVRELARRIDAQLGRTGHATPTPTSKDKGHLLLPLTSRDGDPEVIFLPGIGGHVFTFAPIAERMAHLGVGLRTFGSEPGEEPLSSVEALAAHNLEVLDTIGVSDDIVFAGYSFGGLVAYEMALQRCAAGRPPRRVVIFDTMAPGYPKKLPALTRARLHVETVWNLDWEGRRAYFRDRVASVKEKFNLHLARADAFADAFASGADEVAAMSPAQRERIERLAGISTVAHHRYWPRASIPVPMTLFAAEKDFDWAATKMDDPIKGWRAWVTGTIDRVELSGDHLRLFNPENLDTAARALDRVLADR